MRLTNGIERDSGVALWRQIADLIRMTIASGEFETDSMIPGETNLAARYGVNRHTVRAAIAALVHEGLLEPVQGRGTLVRRRRMFTFPIGRRTRFSEGLADQSRQREIVRLSSALVATQPDVAHALGLPDDETLIRLDLLSSADSQVLACSSNWFAAGAFNGIIEAFDDTGSVTLALARLGIDDYIRKSTDVTARLANPEERGWLELKPGAVVLVSRAINATPDGTPFQYSETSFCG